VAVEVEDAVWVVAIAEATFEMGHECLDETSEMDACGKGGTCFANISAELHVQPYVPLPNHGIVASNGSHSG
jgi:hypothetical protein